MFAMRDDHGNKMNPKGDIYPHLTDDTKDFFSGCLREFQKEIARRGIEDSNKKY
jgi:hypothetical protein